MNQGHASRKLKKFNGGALVEGARWEFVTDTVGTGLQGPLGEPHNSVPAASLNSTIERKDYLLYLILVLPRIPTLWGT